VLLSNKTAKMIEMVWLIVKSRTQRAPVSVDRGPIPCLRIAANGHCLASGLAYRFLVEIV
jgi:hypothetical protein